jgi:hypothetical protein
MGEKKDTATKVKWGRVQPKRCSEYAFSKVGTKI